MSEAVISKPLPLPPLRGHLNGGKTKGLFFAVVTGKGVLCYVGESMFDAATALEPGTFHGKGDTAAAAAYAARQTATRAKIAGRGL